MKNIDKKTGRLWAAAGFAVLAAALPARAEVRTDGLPAGNLILWDELNGGGNVEKNAANDFVLTGSLGNAETATASSSDNSFRFTPGVSLGFAVAAPPSANPVSTPPPPGPAAGDLRAYPVPYKPSIHLNGIKFVGLPGSSGTIKVFSLDGNLVRTLHYDATGAPFVWNPVTDESGDTLASKAFIYVVEGGGQQKMGNLLVVR